MLYKSHTPVGCICIYKFTIDKEHTIIDIGNISYNGYVNVYSNFKKNIICEHPCLGIIHMALNEGEIQLAMARSSHCLKDYYSIRFFFTYSSLT